MLRAQFVEKVPGKEESAVKTTEIRKFGRSLGFTEEQSEALGNIARMVTPPDRRLYMDYAGRIGTKENLADRE